MERSSPVLVAAAGIAAGFLAVDLGPGATVVAGLLLVGGVRLSGAPRVRLLAVAVALGAVTAARAASAPADDAFSARLPESDAVRVVVEGVVASADPPSATGTPFVLDVERTLDAAGRHAAPGRVRALAAPGASGSPALHPGDRVTVAGLASRVPAVTNPGGFDGRAHEARRGVFARLAVPDPACVERRDASDGPLAALSRARHALAARYDETLPAADAGLLRSLVLGDRGALAPDDRERFRAAGAAHVLAISGAHVALLAAGALALLRRLRTPRRPATLVVLVAVALLVPFTGGAAPVVRSAAGFGLFALGRLLGREPSGGVLLASVGATFLVVDPTAAQDPGFRMSFAAAAGLLLLAGRIRRALASDRIVLGPGTGPPPKAPVRAALAAGIAAWLGSTPVAVHDLGQAGLVAVPVGLVVVPLSTLLMAAGTLAASLHDLPALGAGAEAAARALAVALRASLDAPVAAGFVQGPVAPPPAAWYGAYAVAFVVAGRARAPAAGAAFAALAALLGALHPERDRSPPPDVRVTLLDVGHGQAALLETPDGATALLDAGSRDRREVGARVVGPALEALGVVRLDLAVVSHADADHLNAFPSVLAHVPARLLVHPPRFDPAVLSPMAAAVPATLEAADGDVLLAGPWGRLRVLGPARDPPPDRSENDACLVLVVETSVGSLLLAGDLEAAGVDDLLAAHPDLAADVLVVPHHGLPSAGRDRLLAAVRPRHRLVSAADATAALAPAGSRVTGREGALVAQARPDGWHVGLAPRAIVRPGDGYDPPAPMADLATLALAAVVLAGIVAASVRLRWLVPAAASAAGALGLVSVAAFSWAGLAGLLAPFLVATLLGKLPGGLDAGGPRVLRQVLANGLPALLAAGAALAGLSSGAVAFAGALATLGADTVATEIGTRYGGTPRHALTGRALARGESGGVTAAGLLVSVAGAVLAPAAMLACGALGLADAGRAAAAGVVAAWLDSALGAALQRKGRCATCGRLAEGATCCGAAPVALPRRLARLDNDAVNLVTGVAGAVLAWGLAA